MPRLTPPATSSCSPASASLQPATSDVDQIGVVSQTTLSPGSKTVKKGTRITYTATVAPSPGTKATVTFLIYKSVQGVWTYQGSSTVRCDSAGKATYGRTWTCHAGSFYVRARGERQHVYFLSSQSSISKVTVKK